MKEFSPAALIKFREEKNLSQAAFATETGLSRQKLWQWEKGLSVPNTSGLLKIVNRYKLESIDIFFVDIYHHNDDKHTTD